MTMEKWSKIVKARDNKSCRFCGSKDRVEAHHIKEKQLFPNLIFTIENGVTLCHECHLRAHKGHYNPNGFSMYNRFTDAYCQPVIDFINNLAEKQNNN